MVVEIVTVGFLLGIGLFAAVVPQSVTRRIGIRAWLDDAGLSGVPVSVVFITMAVVAVFAGALAVAIVPLPVIAPLGAAVGVAIPVVSLLGSRDSRRRRARAAWPDVIDAIRMSLRAGLTLGESVTAASTMVPRDWQTAWVELDADLHRGADVGLAMRRLQRALADPIADRVVESILITREFGGTELPAVLAELARSVRRQNSIRNEALTRQSWVRHAATLGVISPWIVLAMLASRPENREAYSSHAGTVLIVTSAGATVVAFVVMRALGTLREPGRWLTRSIDG